MVEHENVLFIDEYPELRKRIWLRRLQEQRDLGIVALPQVIEFPQPPNGTAS